MNKALLWFGNGWLWFALLVNVASVIGLFYAAPTFWDGMSRVWEIFGPFNYINWVAEVVLFAPGVGALYWRERREHRRRMG
jgi:hypothetical protein